MTPQKIREEANSEILPQGLTNVANFHNELAEIWDLKYKSGAFKRRAALISEVLDTLQLQGQAWLDAGCGSGFFSRELANRGATTLGIDPAPAMVANAKRLVAPHQSIVFETVETIERTSLASDRFDGVLCLSVLEYLENPLHALQEMVRLMKPQGTIIISIPHQYSPVRRALQLGLSVGSLFGRKPFSYLDLSINAYTRASFERALAKVGLKSAIVRQFDPLLRGPLLHVLPGSLILVVARKA